jgi:CheY-like chemotaxis protein
LEKANTVLVIDDDAGNRGAMRNALEEEGYQVFEASNGLSGLERLRSHYEPLVVLLDWLMPDMDGVRVLATFAAEGTMARRNAYILVSASAQLPEFQTLTLLEDLDVTFLGKPFGLDALLTVVVAAVARLPNQAGQADVPRHTC